LFVLHVPPHPSDPPHVAVEQFGTQQSFIGTPPAPHSDAGMHVFGHVATSPQLFITFPHATPVHACALFGVQHEFGPAPPIPQRLGGLQMFAHWNVWLQLSTAGPHCLPEHGVM
jgi:hypothetical protein